MKLPGPAEANGYASVGSAGPRSVDRRASRLLYDEGGYLLVNELEVVVDLAAIGASRTESH